MLTKAKEILVYTFFVLFAAWFNYILLNILLTGTEYHYRILPLAFLIITSLYILVLVYKGLSKVEPYLGLHYPVILKTFLIVMLILKLSFGSLLRFQPDYDIEAIYQGAIDWLETGSFSNYHFYYYYFPNNLGSMAFLRFFFGIAAFLGLQDYIFAATFLNSLLSISTMAIVFFICKRLMGIKQAMFSLALFAVCLPFYFLSPVFYTDSLSMLFPVLYYYLYLRWKDAPDRDSRWLLVCLMAIVASIGMLVKFTVVIAVIAVTIDMLMNNINWKRFIASNISIFISIFLCLSLFNGYIYSHHLDKEQAIKRNDPYTHWIMMGLEGSGGYHSADYDFTRSFEDPVERKEANIKVIKERIRAHGFKGMFGLYTRKSIRCFGDGTFQLSVFLDNRTENRNMLHRFVISSGDYYDIYRHVCEAIFFSMMIFMVIHGLQHVFTKQKVSTNRRSLQTEGLYKHKVFADQKHDERVNDSQVILAPSLSVFGILLFLLIWETDGRYITNYLPFIFICATMGINSIFGWRKSACANKEI